MASVATFQTVTPSTRPHKARKRAPKACLSCRSRKVRCDVSQRGRPCMNCYLDSETCIVTNRASRFRKGEKDSGHGDDPASHTVYPPEDCEHGSAMEDVVDLSANGEPLLWESRLVNENHVGEGLHTSEYPILEHNMPESRPVRQSSFSGFHGNPKHMFNRPSSPTISFNHNLPSMGLPSLAPLRNPETPLWVGDQQVPVNADITYSYYPFLTISNLHNVMPQDVNHLESQGCLRIPTRAILDEFVQQYFLHVHPLLPFINEGDFWDLYFNQDSGCAGEKMSLLVFQAMLFSCCNYVSKSSIIALGFSDYRTARATLYRRVKLLFDFDTESSLVCLSQTALLLTYWLPNWALATKKPSTAWLGVAIQNAKSAEAHIYSAMPTFSPVTDPLEYKKQKTLKRLWWCVVIRDRLISLGMRRSIQISRAHFDADSNGGLEYPDLGDEVERSKVYNPETKRRLIEIFTQLSELCSVLTDLLTLVFPLNDSPGWGKYNGPEGIEKIKQSKSALSRWYDAAILRFPMPGGGTSRKPAGGRYYHESVILYTNLMYMFYCSARAALCHHEVLQVAMGSATPNQISNNCGLSIYESRHELKDAACGVTDCLNELIQLGLARWLPISAIACTAMPLVLHIIDVKLSSQNRSSRATPEEKNQTALKQHRLNILIEAMKTYQPQYDGVDYISETIRHIVSLAQIDPPCNSSTDSSFTYGSSQESRNGTKPLISDWTDILASHPDSYLRLSMTMDISISKGRLATENDFPVKLRGIFAKGFSPIRALLAGSRPRPPDPQQVPGSRHNSSTMSGNSEVLVPNPSAQIQLGSVHSVSSDEGSASPEPGERGKDSTQGIDSHNNNGQSQPPELFSLFDDTGNVNSDLFGEDGNMVLDDIDYALTADSLTAFVMQADDEENQSSDSMAPVSEEGAVHSGEQENQQRAGTDVGLEANWIDSTWHDEERGADLGDIDCADQADKETARVLLEAMNEDAAPCPT